MTSVLGLGFWDGYGSDPVMDAARSAKIHAVAPLSLADRIATEKKLHEAMEASISRIGKELNIKVINTPWEETAYGKMEADMKGEKI